MKKMLIPTMGCVFFVILHTPGLFAQLEFGPMVTIADRLTPDPWSFEPAITGAGATTVCVIREDGEPIPDVTLIGAIKTDASGCYVFDNPEGIVVTPFKDSPLQEGVNIVDKIWLWEHLLDTRDFSFFQKIAADLNNSQSVSAIDIAEMDKLLSGTLVPMFQHNWRFFHLDTYQPSVSISDSLLPYTFVGIKMGDLDNSFPLHDVTPGEYIDLRIQDEILNAKEEYHIPFYLDTHIHLQGFTIRVENVSGNLRNLEIVPGLLPDFSALSTVMIAPGVFQIRYVVPVSYILDGAALPAGQPLFSLKFESAANSILSEEMSLSMTYDHLLKLSGKDSPFALKFEWEDPIISSIMPIGRDRALEFYPNPATTFLHLKGVHPDDRGHITITDAAGRVVQSGLLSAHIDLKDVPAGLLYLTVSFADGERSTAPLLINKK